MGSTRRHFLAVCGTILGGVTASRLVRGAETSDRFIVDTTNLPEGTLNQPNLDIVYRFPAVDVTVVEGSRETLRRITSEFEPNIGVLFNLQIVQEVG
jgi:hypothetical protein